MRAAPLLAALLSPALAAAEGTRALTLDEALKLTLTRSPEIRRARETVAGQAGSLREAKGAFDLTLRFTPSWQHSEAELSLNSRLNEERRRTQLLETQKAFAQLREGYVQALEKHRAGVPVCPGGFTTIRVNTLIGNVAEEEEGIPEFLCVPLGLGASVPATRQEAQEAAQQAGGLAGLVDSFILPGQGGFGGSLDFEQRLAGAFGLGGDLDRRIEDLRQRGFELLEQGRRLAQEAELRSALGLERLGPIPDTEFRRTLALRIEFTKPLRLGTIVQLQATMDGAENNFRHRPLDPVFGGKGIQNEWHSGVALVIDQPLGKGRGRVSAAAPERAAVAGLDASRQQFQHTVSQRALATTLAYIDLMASQQSLALLETSAESNRRIRDATKALVEAGEKARSELDRIEARVAEAESSVLSTRVSVLDARTSLAQAMGITAQEASALAAGNDFAKTVVEVNARALTEQARARRADLRAATASARASEILFEATRADQKRRLDLSIRIGAGSFYQGPYFRVLKDEQVRNPFEPKDSPLDYFRPEGFWRSLADRWTPTISVKLSLDFPFGNNTAKGRLAQSRASFQQDQIRAVNLGRVIDENVLQAAGSFARTGQELGRRVEAVTQHEATWRSSQDLLDAGEMTLIDVLTTEQNLTSARLQLVQARRDYESALARLRFESGTLVRFRGSEPEGVDFSGLVAD